MFASCFFRIAVFYNNPVFSIEGLATNRKVAAIAVPILILELNAVKRAVFLR